jgi:hypothetical protein
MARKLREGIVDAHATISVQSMPAAISHLAPRLFVPTITWLRAVAVLAVLAVATLGSSARIGGEMNAALQMQSTRTFAIALLAAPIVLAFRSSRSPAQPGNV